MTAAMQCIAYPSGGRVHRVFPGGAGTPLNPPSFHHVAHMPVAGSSLSSGSSGKGGDLLGGGNEFAVIRGKAPNRKKVVPIDEAYPNEQVVKQKDEREVREEKFAEEGLTKEEVKALREREKFDQEVHFDGGGCDLGQLGDKQFIQALVSVGALNTAVAHS